MRSWVPFHPLEKLWGGWNVIWIIITRIAIHSNKDKLTVLGKYNSLFCRYFLIQPVSSPLNVVRTSSVWLFPLYKRSQLLMFYTKDAKMKSRDELHSQQHLFQIATCFSFKYLWQQFHHWCCSTTISSSILQYKDVSLFHFSLTFAWKHQWLIIIVQQIVLFDSICTPFFS